MIATRILVIACLVAALTFADGLQSGGRKLNACKKQDCDEHKEEFKCDAAAWDENECECQCLVSGSAFEKAHDCGDWTCDPAVCAFHYKDFKDCKCKCGGSSKSKGTPLKIAQAPGSGGHGGDGGGSGGGGGGDGGRGGAPGQPGAPGRR